MRIGVGLSIPELSTRGGRFSPASLFAGGVQGAWYAPDDFSTLFQDSAGTTPVTAVEQPVGMMLDKSQGLVLGSELVAPIDFNTGWTASGAAITVNSATSFTSAGVSNYYITPFTVGRWYAVTINATFTGSSLNLYNGASAINPIAPTGLTSGVLQTFYFLAVATQFNIRQSSAGTVTVSSISVKELPGNHASQATSASRPILRARYNLLTYSEQFDNAAWFAGSTTVSANQATAPDGTVTADLVYVATTGASRYIWRTASVFTVTAQVITSSFYVKASSWTWVMVNGTGTNTGVWFNISTGQKGTESAGYTGTITDAGSGWWRVTVTETRTGAVQPTVFLADANNSLTATASGTNGIFLWGAQLAYGSSAGTYQRIAAATDYATAGFLPYLALSTDDSFGTNSIDFTATDKMSVCAGVTKLSDAATAVIVEASAIFSSNNGSFALFAPPAAANTAATYYSRGTTNVSAQGAFGASPATAVLSGLSDINADICTVRVNTAATTVSTDQGTGNYGNYPLYIGRRNNASLPFTGNIYQLVVVGKTLSASELASTEAYVNSKTGAY